MALQAKPAPKGDLGGEAPGGFEQMMRFLAQFLFPSEAPAATPGNETAAQRGPSQPLPAGPPTQIDLSGMGQQPPLPPGWTNETIQAEPFNAENVFGSAFGGQLFDPGLNTSPMNQVPPQQPAGRGVPAPAPNPERMPLPEPNPAMHDLGPLGEILRTLAVPEPNPALFSPGDGTQRSKTAKKQASKKKKPSSNEG